MIEPINIEKAKPRTSKQNNSLNKWCGDMAERFNEAGLDKKAIFKKLDVDIPWNKDSVRDDLFNHISQDLYDKTSSQLDTKQTQVVFKILEKALLESFGFCLPWPDRFGDPANNRFIDKAHT